jgi:hypothetical protein
MFHRSPDKAARRSARAWQSTNLLSFMQDGAGRDKPGPVANIS